MTYENPRDENPSIPYGMGIIGLVYIYIYGIITPMAMLYDVYVTVGTENIVDIDNCRGILGHRFAGPLPRILSNFIMFHQPTNPNISIYPNS
jgi:hypothetical protein